MAHLEMLKSIDQDWTNALQAISEHIQNAERRDFLVKNNLPAFQYLNVEQMPTELLVGTLQESHTGKVSLATVAIVVLIAPD